MADPSEVGKYGTIRLLKQREPASVVAAYPIDDDEVSFGRDSNCSIRLYYPEVSPLHCKIIFEDRKAILQVFGSNGVVVDGCTIYPANPANLGMAPTTVSVPLPNDSIFEIHKKRFVYNCPPKALRPQLFTPAATRRKSVRMSLVQCAQVFSPAPSPYPRENLRVLQSPIKLGGNDAPVTLVNSDRPRVYEEEQDLVILEDMEERHNHPPSPTPVRSQAPPRTPRRSAPSLHRAVLIRSAQRNAYMREETQRQKAMVQPQFSQINLEEDAEGEMEEEDEVVNSILNISGESDEEENSSGLETQNQPMVDEDENPFVCDSPKMEQDHDQNEAMHEEDEDMEDLTPQENATPARIGPIRPLGSFMTPQPQLFAQRPPREAAERRRTGPQRPPPGYTFGSDVVLSGNVPLKDEPGSGDDHHKEPTSPTKRKAISEEERKAILERRKSALSLPDPIIGEGYLSKHSQPSSDSSKTPTQSDFKPPESPFKTLSKAIDEGEDTQVALKRMESQLAQRRASVSPTRPRINHQKIGRDGGEIPKFSLLTPTARLMPFAGMVKREENNENPFQQPNSDAMDVDTPDEIVTSNGSTVPSQPQRGNNTNVNNQRQPQTPRLDDLRTMYGRPPTTGLQTPLVQGVRDLFKEPQAPPQTPRLDGIRQLFAQHQHQNQKRVMDTPVYEGIGDMMPVDEVDEKSMEGGLDMVGVPGDGQDENEDGDREGEGEREAQEPRRTRSKTPTRSSSKPPSSSKSTTTTRTSTRTQTSASRKHNTVAGTPTDMSTMADDEASPDLASTTATGILPKRSRAPANVPEGAMVHRSGRARTRRNVSSSQSQSAQQEEDNNEDDNNTQTQTRRGRSTRIKTEESEPVVSKSPSKDLSSTSAAAVTKPRTRTRTRSDDTTGTNEGNDNANEDDHEASVPGPAKSTRNAPKPKNTRSASGSGPSSNSKPAQVDQPQPNTTTRRTTRARSRSVDVESDLDPEPVGKAQKKSSGGIGVETIHEDEELNIPSSQQAPKRRSGTPSNGNTSTKPTSSATRKRGVGAGSSSTSRPTATEVGGDDVPMTMSMSNKEDKENTPERSPTSDDGVGAVEGGKKAPGVGNGVGVVTRGRTASGNGPASKTAKAKGTKTAVQSQSRVPVKKTVAGTRSRVPSNSYTHTGVSESEQSSGGGAMRSTRTSTRMRK